MVEVEQAAEAFGLDGGGGTRGVGRILDAQKSASNDRLSQQVINHPNASPWLFRGSQVVGTCYMLFEAAVVEIVDRQ